jgi:ketosteroid isomerase-like protein
VSAARTDEEQIVALTVAYCWILDSGDHDRLDEVFAPDAVAEFLGRRHEGLDAIRERISGSLAPLDASQHIVANHQVTVEGDTARCRCYLQAQHVRRDAEGGPNFIIAGTYSDELARTAEGWRIRHRVLEAIWTEGNPAVPRP